MAYSVPTSNKLKTPVIQDLDQSSAVAHHELGETVESRDGKIFQYVYMESSAVKTYGGRPAVWVDSTTDFVVTPDCSDAFVAAVGATGGAAGGAAGHAGCFCMTNADVNRCYLWIQTKGLVPDAMVSTAVAVNDELVVVADDCYDDVQAYASSITDVYSRVVGIAKTAAATGVAGVHSFGDIYLY